MLPRTTTSPLASETPQNLPNIAYSIKSFTIATTRKGFDFNTDNIYVNKIGELNNFYNNKNPEGIRKVLQYLLAMMDNTPLMYENFLLPSLESEQQQGTTNTTSSASSSLNMQVQHDMTNQPQQPTLEGLLASLEAEGACMDTDDSAALFAAIPTAETAASVAPSTPTAAWWAAECEFMEMSSALHAAAHPYQSEEEDLDTLLDGETLRSPLSGSEYASPVAVPNYGQGPASPDVFSAMNTASSLESLASPLSSTRGNAAGKRKKNDLAASSRSTDAENSEGASSEITDEELRDLSLKDLRARLGAVIPEWARKRRRTLRNQRYQQACRIRQRTGDSDGLDLKRSVNARKAKAKQRQRKVQAEQKQAQNFAEMARELQEHKRLLAQQEAELAMLRRNL
eukprot:Clim_evm17s242 gene=Clim_evmTU17s242